MIEMDGYGIDILYYKKYTFAVTEGYFYGSNGKTTN